MTRARVFRYEGYGLDPSDDSVTCRYSVDGEAFVERFRFPGGGDWAAPAVPDAARWLFLLAGVSYYKTGAPPVVDLGDVALSDGERAFLKDHYVDGLGEFAYENGLDLRDLVIRGPEAAGAPAPPLRPAARGPLIPFGGGIDSIVSVELLRGSPDAALFVVGRPGAAFEAIEAPAAVTGLPVVRAEREIDGKLTQPGPDRARYLNGHVPVTAIIAAAAVVAAALEGRREVVMSNEWSASSATIEVDGRPINHQHSKSFAFESAFRTWVSDPLGIDWFSRLRPYSELVIAREFAGHRRYHRVFRSCNRAFHLDPAQRLDRWCGTCDKCCFIDLILSPFLDRAELAAIFDGREPLEDPALRSRFEALLELGGAPAKPFECVGDRTESRAAVLLAAARPDRAGSALVQALAAAVAADGPAPAVEDLLRPLGPHFIPPAHATDDLLV